jgi:hypothetical protein
MKAYPGMAFLPFMFLTPFPHCPSRRFRNSQGSHQVIRRHAAFSLARKACSPRGSALLLPSVEEPCPLRLFTRPSSWPGPRPSIRVPSKGDRSVRRNRLVGGSKRVCPIGRRAKAREGEAGSEAIPGYAFLERRGPDDHRHCQGLAIQGT